MTDWQAIILAAGKGKRMGALTAMTPKPLLSIGGFPLLAHMYRFINQGLGIQSVIVAGGYLYDQLAVEARLIDSRIVCVENKDFEKQNLLSFSAALKKIEPEKNIFVGNADYVFQKLTAKRVSETLVSTESKAAIYSSFDFSNDTEDVMKVRCDGPNGKLREMSKQIADYQAIYTGMFSFSKDLLPAVQKATDLILDSHDQYVATVETLLLYLVNQGLVVNVSDCGPDNWFEIDTGSEWKMANQRIIGQEDLFY